MALKLTLNKFPIDAKTKDKAGLPFGCILQPFAPEFQVIASDAKSTINAGKGLTVDQALSELHLLTEGCEEIAPLIKALNQSTRGIVR